MVCHYRMLSIYISLLIIGLPISAAFSQRSCSQESYGQEGVLYAYSTVAQSFKACQQGHLLRVAYEHGSSSLDHVQRVSIYSSHTPAPEHLLYQQEQPVFLSHGKQSVHTLNLEVPVFKGKTYTLVLEGAALGGCMYQVTRDTYPGGNLLYLDRAWKQAPGKDLCFSVDIGEYEPISSCLFDNYPDCWIKQVARGTLTFEQVDLSNAYLAGVNWEGVSIYQSKLWDIQLERARLSRARIHHSGLGRANLRQALLRETSLLGSVLRGADLFQADLSRASLRGVNFQHANLQQADLRGADLSRADLRGASLEGARLDEATFDGALLDATTRGPLQALLERGAIRQ